MPIPIPKREINVIALHCSDSPNGRSVTPAEIDRWHQEPDKNFHRTDYWRKKFNPQLVACGYQYMIDVDGKVYTGRHIDEIPAQARGHNSNAVGICMIGRDQFTPAQWASLRSLVLDLKRQIKASAHQLVATVKGHYQWPDSGKTCPNFDVPDWFAGGMVADARHVITPKTEATT